MAITIQFPHTLLAASLLLAACSPGEISGIGPASSADDAVDVDMGKFGDQVGSPDGSVADPDDEPEPEPEPGGGSQPSVTFGVAGDFGGTEERAGTVMDDIAERDLAAFYLIGDASYSEIEPEQAWCDWVHDHVGATFPFEVVAGNHEEDSEADGHILDFAACMPDRVGSALGPGGYGVNYRSDLGPVTFIATSPDLEVGGVEYDYDEGSPELGWLLAQIEAAQSEDDWVVVGMHKNCITIGNKTCEIGEAFAQRLIDAGVDLVLQGHDHDYQRTHALGGIVENGVGSIGDHGGDGAYARDAGTVFAIIGTAGTYLTDCSHDDPEYGNFARHWCGEEANISIGYMLLTADSAGLDAAFVTTAGTSFSDAFSIR